MGIFNARIKQALIALSVISLFGFGLPAYGASDEEAQGYTSGALTFKPRLGLYAVNDSNIYTVPGSETDSFIFVQEPGLILEIEPGRHRFLLEYAGEYGQFEESASDDYDEHLFSGLAQLDFGIRHKLELAASVFDSHQFRGSGLTRSLEPGDMEFPAEPDEYADTLFDALYRFGAKGARGRIELNFGTEDREYDNNRSRTRFFDWNRDYAGLAFYYGFRPGTYLVLDAQSRKVEYEEERAGQPSREGDERRLRAGLTWDVTGKTRGRLSVGHISKDFDESQRRKFSGVSWEVDVRFSPREHSSIDLRTTREPYETIGDGDFIDTLSHEIVWTHRWSGAWETEAGFRARNEEFVGTGREEDLTEFRLQVRYQMRRWLGWELGLTRQSNDSTLSELEYDATIYSLGLLFAP